MTAVHGPIDAALRLMDRQIIDSEGRLVGKVDDVELAFSGERLRVAAFLVGGAVWLPRISDRLATQWHLLAPAQPDRDEPWGIPLDLVAEIDSAVHLRVPREEVLQKLPAPHRLSHLLQMEAVDADGTSLGTVTDVRLEHDDLEATAYVIGRRHPGALLGYRRHPDQGPWLVNRAMRWLGRHTFEVDAAHVHLDWSEGVARISTDPRGTP
ncbi:hypothetical protein [Nocardioides sp. Kera G14]|uniref:hypothetical protein n=1 Tax=Nocardioides sp. Kera G14 TaxID=2884264 RepID=UPI001D12223A|nr:hypothetical protein [Nocardioides sp. Kera G14]UDY24937.1 hypothetical protein LH076_06500 [Nocardioides sp. Kera G14]